VKEWGSSSRIVLPPPDERDGVLAVLGSGIFSAALRCSAGRSIIEKWVLVARHDAGCSFHDPRAVHHLSSSAGARVAEIIIIFMPIFLPLLPHFHIDPLFFGLIVRSACRPRSCRRRGDGGFYLKGVSPRT